MSRVFDSHVHTFPDPVAARALQYLSAKSGIKPCADGTRQGLLASMANAGITGALNCPIATRPDQVRSINDWAVRQNAWPVLSFGSIHPDYPEPETELRRVKELGLGGIKLHPEYQEFQPDDPRLARTWAACQELGLSVYLHAGEDIGYPPPCKAPPHLLRQLLAAYPRLRVAAAHFGGWRLWHEVDRELIGHHLYLDVCFVLGFLPDDQLVDMIRRHGVERVLFASDSPWRDQAADLQTFTALPLTPDEQRRILWDNAAELFGFAGR